MLKKAQCIEGSVSIEAAIVIPIIMGMFIFFMSIMQLMYTHGKVQVALNEVCKDLTYDSYLMNELGIITVNQALYSKGLEQSVTVEDLSMLKEQLVEVVPKVASELHDFHFLGSEEEITVENFNNIISDKSEIMGIVVTLHGILSDLSQSIGTEGGYFINTMLLRVYINEKLSKYLNDIDANYTLVHASGFIEDQSGQILLCTEHQIPILFLRKKITLKNGGYFHAFTGNGKYSESYNQVIKKSEYGKNNEKTNVDEEDQDGFAKKVYITKYGSKYHKNKQCFHIKVDVKSIRLNRIHGKRSCEYCGDALEELSDNTLVYTTSNSEVFHVDRRCHSIYHHISSFSEKEAIAKGYVPCKSCSN